MKPFAQVLSVILAAAAALLAGCKPESQRADGVELVLGSETPTPGMTFELRFDTPMAKASEIGVPANHSPLVIRPRLAGTFTWLSPRNGVFTPAEALELDTTYHLSLRPGIATAGGQPVPANIHRTVVTPPFGLNGAFPAESSTNASSEPEIKLVFNAEVRAAEAARFIYFRDRSGRRIPADVRQGLTGAAPRWPETQSIRSAHTWAEEFSSKNAFDDDPTEHSPTNEIANLLLANPQIPLPLGKDWKLVLDAGLRADNRSLCLRTLATVPIGDVTPFVVAHIATGNYLNSGPTIWIDFSKPLPDSLTNRFSEWLNLEPSPSNLVARVFGRTLMLSGNFISESSYNLAFKPGLPAAEPFTLTGTNQFSLYMPSVPPRLYFPALSKDQMAGGNRTFPLLSVNVAKARIRAKLMDPQTAIHALRGYQSYILGWRERRDRGDWNEPYRAVDYNVVPGRTVFNEEIDLASALDESRRLELSWDRMIPGRKTGVVFLDAERETAEGENKPRLGTQAVIQLTDLGMIWKRSKDAVDCFVFSEATGQPIAGASARLYTDENETLSEALTDANGWAQLQNATKVSLSDLSDTSDLSDKSNRSNRIYATWIAVRKGDDFHALALAENRVWMYGFDLPYESWNENENPRRVLLFSDRNLYRPGEEVHLEGFLRNWTEHGLAISNGSKAVLECSDARERKFFKTNVVFDSAGSFSTLIPLPITSVGVYAAKLRFGTNAVESGRFNRSPDVYEHTFRVQEFQPSAFEIAVDAKSTYAAGEKIEIPVAARYFFGKALSRAQVKWSLTAEDNLFRPKGFEDFQFRRVEIDYRRGAGNASVNLNGEGMLSGSSNMVIAPTLPINPASPQPRLASLLVEVTDVNQQTLSRRAELIQQSSDFYLGLNVGTEVLAPGKLLPLRIIALRPDGKPWPESIKAELTLQHVEWQNVRVQGAGKTLRYHNEPIVTNVYSATIEVPALRSNETNSKTVGRLSADFPALAAGQYVAEVKSQDAAGRPVIASLTFSVSAPESAGWNFRNETQVTLKHDRDTYTPGETANILVEAPFGGTALVTVERERVLRSFVTQLAGNAPMIQVPLEPGDVPNIFVSVALIRGAENSPHKIKEPEYRIGYCGLTVANRTNRLEVIVSPVVTSYLPAQTVEVSARVSDFANHPVSGAQVVLYAVDEGILSLADYDAPDPFGFFYAARPLGVQSSISLPNLLTEDPEQRHFENKGYLGGGGGMNRVRKNFLACAFWNASLITDAEGKVTARFPAPDSLTRYRVFAVVQSGAELFGAGQSSFQVNKPLLIEPALPAFANISDHLLTRGVIQNQTTNRGDVLVTLTLDGTAKLDANSGLTRQLSVPDGGSAVVEFPVEFTEAGTAKWTWRAHFADPGAGGFADAVESRIEVGHLAPLLREVLLSRMPGISRSADSLSARTTNLLATSNPQLLSGNGTVTITIANTRLAELGEAVSQLLHYPYGCVEQTSSSLLPWILLRDETSLAPILEQGVRDLAGHGRGLGRLSVSSSTSNEIATVIRVGVARLFSMQTASGGLAYWPGGKEPMLWASGYGGMVLALARRHGIDVPRQEFDSLLKYLSQQLRSNEINDANSADGCLALYALALTSKAEPAYHEKFFLARDKLSTEDRALLALAIAEGNGPSDMAAQLLQPGAARSGYGDGNFGCAARSKAVALLAWMHHEPENAIVDRFVNELMNEQKRAHWGTTQGDAWALLALTDYAHQVEGAIRPSAGRLTWGDQSISFQLTGQTNRFSKTFSITHLPNGIVNLVNDAGNPLYVTTSIEARPPETPQPRQNHGFSLQRRYQRLDDDNRAQNPGNLRVGDRVLVTLNLNVTEPARYVVIDDTLPAILEAINPEFKTREARGAADFDDSEFWPSDFRELRKDRCLSFADWIPPGNYSWRYVARVRAAGTVNAPSAKVEEMYLPERYGLTGSQVVIGTAQ